MRELALFNLGIDSQLRGRDPVALRVLHVCHGDQVARSLGIEVDDTREISRQTGFWRSRAPTTFHDAPKRRDPAERCSALVRAYRPCHDPTIDKACTPARKSTNRDRVVSPRCARGPHPAAHAGPLRYDAGSGPCHERHSPTTHT